MIKLFEQRNGRWVDLGEPTVFTRLRSDEWIAVLAPTAERVAKLCDLHGDFYSGRWRYRQMEAEARLEAREGWWLE